MLLAPISGQAQKYRKDENTDPDLKPQKVGVRAGTSTGWLHAPDLMNGKTQLGLQGAIYYRINLQDRLHLQAEFGAAYRGSRFTNGETGYSRMGLFYIDLPVYAMLSLDKKQNSNLLIGPVVSYLLRPALYLGNEVYPSFTNLPIKKMDYAIAVSYLISTEVVGIQISYKHGLSNISRSFDLHTPADGQSGAAAKYLDEVTPSLKNVNSIFVRSIELSLYF
jgi:hypothetical protein